jgi:hypothetical protein
MKADRPGRLYDRLDPEERFRATIRSLAREDDVDAERLSRTCPQRVYHETDRAFGERLRASRIVTETFVFSILPALEKLEMLSGLSNLLGRALEGAADQVELAYEIGRLDAQTAPDGAQSEISPSDAVRELRKPIDEGRERITAFVDETRRRVATEAKSLLEAFEGCCRDQMGVELKRSCVPTSHPSSTGFVPKRSTKSRQIRSLLRTAGAFSVTPGSMPSAKSRRQRLWRGSVPAQPGG